MPVDVLPHRTEPPSGLEKIPPPSPSVENLPPLERYIYGRILNTSSSQAASLSRIHTEYVSKAGRTLDAQLPYESTPSLTRRVQSSSSLSSLEDDGVVVIAHLAVAKDGQCRVSLSSGFALALGGMSANEGDQCVATCCHTLEEIIRPMSPESLLPPSGIYVISASGDPIPVTSIYSSLPRNDVMLLSIPREPRLRTLPLSPYPAPDGGTISVRLFSSPDRSEGRSGNEREGWNEWLSGHALRKWTTGGKVLGYRDLAGRESKPGTYDALSHMLFDILPTPGSSGAPLVDERGAVVGMALGTRMDNRVEGNRGWGIPSELIYEMFSLPGLSLNKK